jgi:hypothetical protein
MTSVPATINSFIKDLEDYMDFKFLDEQDAVFFALRWSGASLQNA